jgi:hypothetical protein
MTYMTFVVFFCKDYVFVLGRRNLLIYVAPSHVCGALCDYTPYLLIC